MKTTTMRPMRRVPATMLCAAALACGGLGEQEATLTALGEDVSEADTKADTAAEAPPEGGACSPGLDKAAQTILETHCGPCHGSGGKNTNVFSGVPSPKAMEAQDKLVPGNAGESQIFRRMKDGSMPTKAATSRPTPAEVDQIAAWIECGAASPVGPVAEPIALEAVMAAAVADLKALDTTDAKFMRYVSLVHLHNLGLSAETLDRYRRAVSKLVNSLSWAPAVHVPVAVGPQGVLLRVDLRHIVPDDDTGALAWWTTLQANNPYRATFTAGADMTTLVQELSGEVYPVTPADWFVNAASRSDGEDQLYEQLLNLPGTAAELANLVGADLAYDVAAESDPTHPDFVPLEGAGLVARAGFVGSGVSEFNRLVERHSSIYGAYWISYDFKSDDGRKNLPTHPLGPCDDESCFLADGGEIIFNLPNGLQAYMLVGPTGDRIPVGPIEVVGDDEEHAGTSVVKNGISCMGCHDQGMKAFDDTIRSTAQQVGAFSEQDRQVILALYPEKAELDAWRDIDARQFMAALGATGQPASEQADTVAPLFREFEQDVTPARAAVELGLTETDFTARLRTAADQVPPEVLGLANGTNLKRPTFAKAFATIACAIGAAVSTVQFDAPTCAALHQ